MAAEWAANSVRREPKRVLVATHWATATLCSWNNIGVIFEMQQQFTNLLGLEHLNMRK
jgi:hypothetical protein